MSKRNLLKPTLFLFLASMIIELLSVSGVASATPTLQWDQTSIQGRNVRLLASATGKITKWCLAIDGTPVKKDVSSTRYQEFEVFGAPFNLATGCWEAPTGFRMSGAFYVPMSSVAAGPRLFTVTVFDIDGTSASISQTMTAVHPAPVAQWDWRETNAGVATGKVTGVINYGFSTDDPVVKWCLQIDSTIIQENLARTRSNDYEISDYSYDPATGCWSSEEQFSIFSGLFIVPTQTLKNGPHILELKYIDRYGESGTLSTQFESTNKSSVSSFWVGDQAKPYPSKLSVLRMGAMGSSVTKYTIKAGYSRLKMKVVKSGKVKNFGQIETTIGTYRANSKVYVQITVIGINGKATATRVVKVAPPLPNPVPPALPRSNSAGFNMFNPMPGLPVARATIVGQDCILKPSPMSSDWQGQGYSWTYWYTLSNGTRTPGKSGFGFEYGYQGFAIPSECHR
jgi:hypothetical protein